MTGGGACELAGHLASACSMITSPSPAGVGFPNTGGKMCMTGVAARVVNNATTGQPDFGGIYGVTIGFDFNYPTIAPPKGTFNALANGVTGIQFDVDLVPTMACALLGTVPPQCWPAGIACSTVTDCGGGDYEG